MSKERLTGLVSDEQIAREIIAARYAPTEQDELDQLLYEPGQKPEPETVLDDSPEVSYQVEDNSPISPEQLRNDKTIDKVRDAVFLDILDFPEGDSPLEVLKTGFWEVGQSITRQAPVWKQAVKNIIAPVSGRTKETWDSFDARTRKLVFAVGLTATIFGGVAYAEHDSVEPIQTHLPEMEGSEYISSPKEIAVDYFVPDSTPRAIDLAVAMDADPQNIADQVSEQIQVPISPEDNMPAGQTLHVNAQGSIYETREGDTIVSLCDRFGVPPNVLRAANVGLVDIPADSILETKKVIIPRPVNIVQFPENKTIEEVADIPAVANLIGDQIDDLAEIDPDYQGDTLVIPNEQSVNYTANPETETTPAAVAVAAEVDNAEISPEVARVNAALDSISITSDQIDISELTQAVIEMDKSFRPNDKDRLANTPEGTVKMMLPHEAIGINVPYTVAERTADVERYTSPQTYAVFLATAKLYQLRLAEYPELAGTMLRMRDGDAPAHSTHNNGTSLDISSANGWGVEQYADGPFGDYQFSDMFNQDFNETLLKDMAKLRVGEAQAIRRVLSSGNSMVPNVNNALGITFMKDVDDNHKDHYHLIINPAFKQPQWRPTMANMPWNDVQDLKIAGEARSISTDQHASQHADFEEYITKAFAPISGTGNTQPNSPTTQPAEAGQQQPESINTVVDELDASDVQKEFLKEITTKVIEVSDTYHLNPYAVLAQAGLESGYGQSELSKSANNLFGIKVGSDWNGSSVELIVGPEGGRYPAEFRKYDSFEESIEDYAKLIDSRPWYDDAQVHYQDTRLYLRGLLDELNADGSVAKKQGDEGVLSYDFTPDYDQRVIDIIESLQINKIIDAAKGDK